MYRYCMSESIFNNVINVLIHLNILPNNHIALFSLFPRSTPDSSCFSLVFIKNLINDKSKQKKKNFTICFVLSGAPHSYL